MGINGVLTGAATIFVLAGASAVIAGDANLLLGTWKFSGQGFVDREGHNWCDQRE